MAKIEDAIINTDNLIKKMYGKRQVIDWDKNIGREVEFIYHKIYKGKIKIIDVIHNKDIKLLLKYNNIEREMRPYDLIYGHIGSLINVITNDFKYNIGDIVNNPNRKMKILGRYKQEYKNQYKKYYTVKCLICNSEYDIEECNFTGQYVNNKCKHCLNKNLNKNEFNKEVNKNKYYSNSYPERLMISFLNYFNINYVKEYSPNWANTKRYDFYFELNNEKYIIETHGLQHYEKGFGACGGRTLEEEQENDKYKKELALKNNIKEDNYMVIDCRYSELEYIKNNIINSKINEIFELDKIDWDNIELKSISQNRKNIISDFESNSDEKDIIKTLSLKYGLSNKTIKKILSKYSKVYEGINVYTMCLNNNMCFSTLTDICCYFNSSISNVSQAINNNGVAFSKKYNTYVCFKKISKKEYYEKNNFYYEDLLMFTRGKSVRVYNLENEYVTSFPSINSLCENSNTKLGINIEITGVRYQINKSKKDYKGYFFEMISKEDYLKDVNRL